MTLPPTRPAAPLLPIARAYLRQAAALGQRTIAENQDGPWTNIAFGAAGVGYALWRAGGPGRRQRLEEADRILGEAADAAPNDVWPTEASIPRFDPSAGLYYAAGGIEHVRILVAHARGDRPTYERELAAFLARCLSCKGGADELLVGMAGLLNGARLLHKHTKEERVVEVADRLAESLNERANDDAGGWATWAGTSAQGFAHGAPGILHAILAWSQEAGRELRGETKQALVAFAQRPRPEPLKGEGAGALPRVMERSWCNGSAGHLLLWAQAYERTGEKTYLELARASARSTLTLVRGARPDLCCGLGGRAFALLAMDRIEPGRGWYGRALEMTFRAMRAAQAAIGAWPNGLFKGYPGLVCLIADLDTPSHKRKGFPLVEG
jgi:hypothetical protein